MHRATTTNRLGAEIGQMQRRKSIPGGSANNQQLISESNTTVIDRVSSQIWSPNGKLNATIGNNTRNWKEAKSTWLVQLLNSDISKQQTSLAQLTLLIGSVLSLILFATFLLRKTLVPKASSYHWLVTKRTMKSTKYKCDEQIKHSSATRLHCHHHNDSVSINSVLCHEEQTSGTSVPLDRAQVLNLTRNRWPPSHLGCDLSRRGDLLPVTAHRIRGMGSVQDSKKKQFFVDSNGYHFIGINSSNADSRLGVLQSSSNCCANIASQFRPQNNVDMKSFLTLNECDKGTQNSGNCDYQEQDSLNTSLSAELMKCCKKGFISVREFVPCQSSRINNQSSGSIETQTKSQNFICSDDPRRTQIMQYDKSIDIKHRSPPSVPDELTNQDNRNDSFDLNEFSAKMQGPANNFSSTFCSGSSANSDHSNSNSASIQSTTAPILSNATSSSLERAPEVADLTDLLPSQTPMTVNIIENHFSHRIYKESVALQSKRKQKNQILDQTEIKQIFESQDGNSLVAPHEIQSNSNWVLSTNQLHSTFRRGKFKSAHPSANRSAKSQISLLLRHSVNESYDLNKSERRAGQQFDRSKIDLNDSSRRDKNNEEIKTNFCLTHHPDMNKNCDNEDDRHYYEEIIQPHEI